MWVMQQSTQTGIATQKENGFAVPLCKLDVKSKKGGRALSFRPWTFLSTHYFSDTLLLFMQIPIPGQTLPGMSFCPPKVPGT